MQLSDVGVVVGWNSFNDGTDENGTEKIAAEEEYGFKINDADA